MAQHYDSDTMTVMRYLRHICACARLGHVPRTDRMTSLNDVIRRMLGKHNYSTWFASVCWRPE